MSYADEEGKASEFFSYVLQELTEFAREVMKLCLLEPLNNKYGVLNLQVLYSKAQFALHAHYLFATDVFNLPRCDLPLRRGEPQG